MPKAVPQGPEGTIWFGGDPDEARLCLRICGDTLDPDAVSQTLETTTARSRTGSVCVRRKMVERLRGGCVGIPRRARGCG